MIIKLNYFMFKEQNVEMINIWTGSLLPVNYWKHRKLDSRSFQNHNKSQITMNIIISFS